MLGKLACSLNITSAVLRTFFVSFKDFRLNSDLAIAFTTVPFLPQLTRRTFVKYDGERETKLAETALKTIPASVKTAIGVK